MINKKKIIWHNIKVYDLDIVSERIKFVEENMNKLLPIYDKEKEILRNYAETHGLPIYEMICLRNTIRIQKEINASRNFHLVIEKIKKQFSREVDEISTNNFKLEYFLKSIRMPLNHIFKLLESTQDFKKLSKKNLEFINKIKKKIKESEQEIHYRAMQFERSLEIYLADQKLRFRTEEDIKIDKDYTITPDILFDEPITVELDGVKHVIRWMDAKNYMLVNVPFIMKSLHKQAAKYNNTFGPGAFVFHYGYDKTIAIPNTTILDGSFLEPL